MALVFAHKRNICWVLKDLCKYLMVRLQCIAHCRVITQMKYSFSLKRSPWRLYLLKIFYS